MSDMARCEECLHFEVCEALEHGNGLMKVSPIHCGCYKPAADVVETEKYNDLREAFIDFVCSGVHNPAPYCKNRCDGCVDKYGCCTYKQCNGFNPDNMIDT